MPTITPPLAFAPQDLSSELSPEMVTSMLDRLYRELDNLSAKYELFKAETIGDAFLAVAGIPNYQSDHTARVRCAGDEAG